MTVKNAFISDDGLYRYWLTRKNAEGEICLPFIMLNPSTADASVDDPTIRRCMSFAKREGFNNIIVLNLFSLRATNPKELAKAIDPTGPHNPTVLDVALRTSLQYKVPLVCAWGAHPFAFKAAASIVAQAISMSLQLRCLGTTAEGHPRHPLYVRADQTLQDYP